MKEMLRDEIDLDEKKKERVHHGERRFTQKAAREGETIDLIGQDSSKYTYRIKYTPPPWAYSS